MPCLLKPKTEECSNLENKRLRVQFHEADLVAISLPLFVAQRSESQSHVGHPGSRIGVKLGHENNVLTDNRKGLEAYQIKYKQMQVCDW